MARTTERVLVRTAGMMVAAAAAVLFALASAAAADVADPTSQSFNPYQAAQPATQTGWTPSGDRAAPASPAPSPAPVASPAPSDETAGPAQAEPVPAPVLEAEPAPEPIPLSEAFADVDRREAPTTPVPETIVTRSVNSGAVPDMTGSATDAGPVTRVVRTVTNTLTDLRVSLAEAASACKVGMGSGAGGPVLILAVLGTFAALTGRRALGAQWVADEEVPEMLYAWEVIAPG